MPAPAGSTRNLLSHFTGRAAGCGAPNSGGCAPFVDPASPAPNSAVVWTAASGARIIEATAQRNAKSATGDLDLASPLPGIHIHIDPSGLQHVTLSAPRLRVQLVITGMLATCTPITLAFKTVGVANLPKASADYLVLTQLLTSSALSTGDDRPGPVERLELRDALIALDGKASGATHRQIARISYGPERVTAEWGVCDSPMRQKIKRDLARGRRLTTGGYRALLGRWQLRSLSQGS